MKMITLENVSDKNIVDYPIAEPDMTSGEVRYDTNKNIISTGKTLLWTIEAGKKKAFPEYVTKVLLARYGVEEESSGRTLLKVVGESEEKVEKDLPENGCRHCGKVFKNKKGLALHYAAKHPEEL